MFYACFCSSDPSGINYIPFIPLGTTPGVDTQTLPNTDDGASDPITVPNDFPMGFQFFSTVYVRLRLCLVEIRL